ncbi:MAG: metallophosphatase family protein [Spirochaetaceae bacterium]
MKIAVLADIHGNLQALEVVLTHAKEHKVDKYIIAGDMITDCPSNNTVLKKMMMLDAYIIKGNREDYILNEINSDKNEWIGLKQMESVLWAKNQLKKIHLDWIKSLPDNLSISFKNMDSILLVHGSPDNQFELLYPHNLERLTEIANNIQEQVLICGHSHTPWESRINNKLILNPGSVGVAFNKNVAADYGIIEWDENRWNVEHYSIPYDIKSLENDFLSNNTNHFIWSRLIIQSIKDGKNRNIEFIKLVQEIMDNQGLKQGKYFPNDIWEEAINKWEDIYPPT